MFQTVADFVRQRIRVGRPPSRDLQQEKKVAQSRGEQARALVESDIYILAYQDELACLVERVLSLDMTKSSERDQALLILAQIQQHQQLARRLAGYVNSAKVSP